MNKIHYKLGIMLALLFWVAPMALGKGNDQNTYRAKILQVDNIKNTKYGFQQVIIAQFIDGPYAPKTINLIHEFHGYPSDLKYCVGHFIFVKKLDNPEDQRFAITGPVRDYGLYILMAIFVCGVVFIAGFQGIRSILSLSLIFLVIFLVLVPLVIKGSNPISVTLILAALSTVFTIFFVSGVNRKTIAAVTGTICGVVTAGLLAWHFGNMVLLTGYSDETVQMLQYTSAAVNFKGLLFSGMIMGALGAIMDIAVSVASSITELKQSNPQISFNSLITSGFRVGKDAISTMINTLVLAYLGGSFPLLMLYQIHRTPFYQIINHDSVAAELVRMLAGSIGLLAAVPITVFIAVLFNFNDSLV